MNFKNIAVMMVCATAALLVSCDEPIKLDLRQSPSRIVIEGLVTNNEAYQSIKITKSVGFYDTGETPRITNAVVTVSDDQGNVYPFVHNPGGNEDSTGIYIPETPFAGVVGRTYALKVDIDGELYEAEDQLLSVINMDSLKYQVNEDEADDPEEIGKIYELLIYAHEPQDETNYYLFKFFRNDSIMFENDTDIYYSDDKMLAGEIDGITSPIFFGHGDEGKVETFSMTRRGFVYYNDLSGLLNNDGGGMFGSIPASPRTNLSNNALGFFHVGSVSISEIEVE